MGRKVTVKQDADNPVESEVLATAIVKIAKAATALSNSGLNRRAVVALIKDATLLNKGIIEKVLDALEDLRRDYCK